MNSVQTYIIAGNEESHTIGPPPIPLCWDLSFWGCGQGSNHKIKFTIPTTCCLQSYITLFIEEVWERILLPTRETRRDVGRGLSKTNLESRHSWRMKLLWERQCWYYVKLIQYLVCSFTEKLPFRPSQYLRLTRGVWHQQSVQQWRYRCGCQHGGPSSGGQPVQTGLSAATNNMMHRSCTIYYNLLHCFLGSSVCSNIFYRSN